MIRIPRLEYGVLKGMPFPRFNYSFHSIGKVTPDCRWPHKTQGLHEREWDIVCFEPYINDDGLGMQIQICIHMESFPAQLTMQVGILYPQYKTQPEIRAFFEYTGGNPRQASDGRVGGFLLLKLEWSFLTICGL